MIGSQGTSDYDTVADLLREDRDRALAAAAERAAQTAPGLLIDTDVLTGEPAQAITDSGTGALMLVVGSRGISAFTAMVLGSVSRYAAIHASCPVVVVRDETTATHKQIGVGVGDPESSAAALEFAFEEAALRKASVMAIHAWHTPEFDISRAGPAPAVPAAQVLEAAVARDLAALLDSWREKYPDVPVSQDVVHGHPGPGAGRPVRPRRPGGHRQAQHAHHRAWSGHGHPRRAESRARAHRHGPLILIAGSQAGRDGGPVLPVLLSLPFRMVQE